ncbi:N-acyl-D-amino-acid deacylase [Sphingomonas gellani]|uniref:N-acyl-D-amino-acid deacylase n=1 Tax=Sphingomonas gellani TaxID=1166340 RepID=A0A1H8AYU2_9SPHN|nr:D-aminoacylase [Sphingomonas gellani]SEM75875.1 N-acyl-D-amino-acid deacylase [Sphingomonas gellani]
MSRLIIAGAEIFDGTGALGFQADVEVRDGIITSVEPCSARPHPDAIDARGLALAPGFIDAHTHDDLVVVAAPDMTPKITQGVTTVVVGNCGISAGGDFTRHEQLPDPIMLLGTADQFRYPDYAAYADAVDKAVPATNVVALIGHTTLRALHMDRLDREATDAERSAMRSQIEAALAAGAFGLSTGLAYANAACASTTEVKDLVEALRGTGALYCTHLRSEGAQITAALEEAFAIGRHGEAPIVVSHLKCAGAEQHGRSTEILSLLDQAAEAQSVGCDCYPYTASSSTLDIKQVVPQTPIKITWSDAEPAQAGRMLADIAADWGTSLRAAAERLQPAGAVYHCMADADVDTILSHRITMIGSDGLPCDPRPHPRLWGSFPRVLGHYARERGLFPLATAIRKMTGLTADRFGLADRGYVRAGMAADLVLFDPATISDRATYDDPTRPAGGIHGVWVNGTPAVTLDGPKGQRAGRMLRRASPL